MKTNFLLIGASLFLLSFSAKAKIMPINQTRGERNNNPGNIRFDSRWTWQGQIGKDKDGYLLFDTVENGIRAIGKDLLSKFSRGLNTVRKIIEVYAPSFENNTEAYISAVSRSLGVEDSAVIDLYKTGTMQAFITAIIKHENGRVSYSSSVINSGVRKALS